MHTQPTNIFLCDLTHMGQGIASDTFPLGIGCIAAYLEKMDSRFVTHLFKFPDDLHDALVKYRPPVVGFSNYVWNGHLAVAMAGHIKQLFPQTVIVFGGPNFFRNPKDQERFLRRHPMIDFYIEGEGERAFHELVSNLMAADFDVEAVKASASPSIRAISGERFVSRPEKERIKDLDAVPSPYLTGKFDSFFQHNLMPLVQTNRGCPFTCSYCVEGHSYYSRVVKKKDRQRLYAELEYIARRVQNNRQLFIADSNFGMYKEDLETAEQIRQCMDSYDFPVYIHVATGKNKKERVLKIAETLKGKLRLSGSVQSLSKTVLKKVRRTNISTSQLLNLAQGAKTIGANSYSEIILGLPGDSRERFEKSVKGTMEAGFNYILPWTLMVLNGSPLEEEKASFGVKCRYRVLPRCFGQYRFGDRTFISGEIENVCVENDTMGFDAYVQCREIALTAALFYNDRIFSEIIELIGLTGLSVFEWIMEAHAGRESFSPALAGVYRSFRNSTVNELWDSKAALADHLYDPQNIGWYISGEVGFNVLNKHRLKAMVSCMDDINGLAFAAYERLAKRSTPDGGSPGRDFIEQLRHFSLQRKSGLFDFGNETSHVYHYNFTDLPESFKTARGGPDTAGLPEYRIAFKRTPEQEATIKEQIDFYGDNEVGLTKVVSRIPIWTLFRSPVNTGAQK